MFSVLSSLLNKHFFMKGIVNTIQKMVCNSKIIFIPLYCVYNEFVLITASGYENRNADTKLLAKWIANGI